MIDTVLDRILAREGGFVDHPNDPGGATNFGVTLGTLRRYRKDDTLTAKDVKALTQDEARTIYRQLYIERPGFDRVTDFALLDLLVDIGVNHGPTRAIEWVQRAAGLKEDGVMGPKTRNALDILSPRTLCKRLVAERARFYGRRITQKPSQAVFAAGWMNRLADFIEAL